MRAITIFFVVSLVLRGGGAEGGVARATTDQLLLFYQQRVARDPEDFSPYTHLGQLYLQKARETGDPSYYDFAEQALRKSLPLVSQQPAAAPAMTYLAAVLFAKHLFQEAIRSAQQALLLAPHELLPYAIIGDVYIELGEYGQVAQAYGRLLQGHPDSFSAMSRLAHLRFLHGDTAQALGLARAATELAVTAHVPAENIAWAQAEEGHLRFQVGDLSGAERAYQQALQTFSRSDRALAGQVRTAQHRYAEAIVLYRQAVAVVPALDCVAALGDVYAKTGAAEEAREQYDLVEYIGALTALHQTIHNRELALFYTGHDIEPKEARELAQKELQVRRDIYTYDVLA